MTSSRFTGFTELLNMRKRLREISVDGCDVIGREGPDDLA